MNGIFRDVYLLHRPEQCIEDYFITTDIHGSTAEVAVRLRYYDSAVATRITLYDLLAEALFLYSALPSKIGQSTGY